MSPQRTLIAAAAALLLCTPASAKGPHGEGAQAKTPMGDQARAKTPMGENARGTNPYTQPDDSWISLSGTVKRTTSDGFALDYGKGTINVELDDFDSYREVHRQLVGQKVTVFGRVDDDIFEKTEIEATRIYAQNLNSYFYANDADVSDFSFWSASPIDERQVTLTGKVTRIDGDEFMLDTGKRQMRVETDEMDGEPLEKEGLRHIKVGDRVSVTGEIDDDLFEKRELEAKRIVTLRQGKRTVSSR